MTRSSHYRIGRSLKPHCVILAAGSSTRLRPLTDDTPKCLLEVGGRPLLERTIQNVRLAGIRSIAIVVGFGEEKIREFVGRRFAGITFHFIVNAKYAETNNAYSLWLARRFTLGSNKNIERGLLLLDSDILFPSTLLPCLLSGDPSDVPGDRRDRNLVDPDGVIAVRRKGPHDSEEVLVRADDKSFITTIGKGIETAESYGESIGIEVFSARATKKLFRILRKRIGSGNGRTEFYEASFQQMIEEGSTLRALDVSAFPALEIDTPADLLRARALRIDETENAVQARIRYAYRSSIKSSDSDELINTYVLRPVAGLIVWALFYTPVTPNQVTIASVIAGLAAAIVYAQGTPGAFLTAGLLVTLKDLLDSADGQLARAKRQYSRIGRFLDSIGDFIVDAAIFGVIGWLLFRREENPWMIVLAFLGFVGISFRVSYHVYYHSRYLHLRSQYENNRITEEVREEDVRKGGPELLLQRLFQLFYGWQDRLVMKIDAWTARTQLSTISHKNYTKKHKEFLHRWYSDLTGLRLSGFLGFGTELFVLTVCSILGKLESYLYINLFLMNGILLACVIYRRGILSLRIQRGA